MTTAASPKPKIKRKFRLLPDQYAEIAKIKGWNTNAEAAEDLGVSEAQISRIRSGKAYASDEFMAALLDVFPLAGFRRTFQIVRITDGQEEVIQR